MASHPSMLLDPKAFKKQAQNNGNHPTSSSSFSASSLSTFGDLLEMKPTSMPEESVQVSYGSSTTSSAPASPSFVLLSPGSWSPHTMDTSMTSGGVLLASVDTFDASTLDTLSDQVDAFVASGEDFSASVETAIPPTPDSPSHQMDTSTATGEAPVASSNILVTLTLDDSRNQMDTTMMTLASADTLIPPALDISSYQTDTNMTRSEDPIVPIEIAVPSARCSPSYREDTSMETGEGSVASVEILVSPALDASMQNMDTTMTAGEVSISSVETHDPTALDFPCHTASSPHDSSVFSRVTDPMSAESTLTLGSLLEPIGRRKKNDTPPAHPMAPPGTAMTSFRGPSPMMASPKPPTSRVSSPVPKPESNLTVQFTTTLDEANESDSKRSHYEMSDDEDVRRPNFVEDLYGVEHRKNPPTKKVKTDDTDEMPKMANTPITISGDTGLGTFMKEGEGNRSATPTASAVVDLTTGITFFMLKFVHCGLTLL
jgi:hypothetical protein